MRPVRLNGFNEITSISIHAPYIGCDDKLARQTESDIEISIHAPYIGCDMNAEIVIIKIRDF